MGTRRPRPRWRLEEKPRRENDMRAYGDANHDNGSVRVSGGENDQ